MPSNNKKVVLAVIGMYVVLVLFWGFFLVQQILLAGSIAILGALLGGLAYVAWQYFGGKGGSDDENPQI